MTVPLYNNANEYPQCPHQAYPCRYSTDETPLQYEWNAVTVRMERRYSTGGTRFQYGWNPVPVRMEPGSSTDGTRTDLSIGALRIFINAA